MANTITDLKVQLYDVIEQQAVLQSEYNRLDQIKGELAKRLGEARRAEAEKTTEDVKTEAKKSLLED